MSEVKSEAVARVEAAAEAKGLKINVVETKTSARSAAEAADAVGARVSQIVKSLVFKGAGSGTPYLLLVSGKNRVDLAHAAELAGEALDKADAGFVRQVTGFAIGGVAPIGATGRIAVLMDEDLFEESTVWAAAGSPIHVFEAVPLQLRSATRARVGRLKED